MPLKTHTTALVLVPPEDLWEPIQAIRRLHDRKVRRWMPHVTLLYPFHPREEFDRLEGLLRAACARVEPFRLELARFRHFRHAPRSFTLWLEPAPAAPLVELQRRLEEAVPACDDVRRHGGAFTPHLSVGQLRGTAAELRDLLEALAARWTPLAFTARSVQLLWRREPPDDIFRIDRSLELGGAAAARRPD